MHHYKVTCLNCKKSDTLFIDDNNHVVLDYQGKFLTPFRSFRWRPDLIWGFECTCGQDSRLAPEEKSDIGKLVQGDPVGIEKVIQSLKTPAQSKFKMVAI